MFFSSTLSKELFFLYVRNKGEKSLKIWRFKSSFLTRNGRWTPCFGVWYPSLAITPMVLSHKSANKLNIWWCWVMSRWSQTAQTRLSSLNECKISFCSLNPHGGSNVLCEKPNFSPQAPVLGSGARRDSFHISWLVDWFGLCWRFWGESYWFQRASSLSVFWFCSVTRCWPGPVWANVSGLSSCRVIPGSDLVLSPQPQMGPASSSKTSHTANKAYWYLAPVPTA